MLWAGALLALPADMAMRCKGKDHQDLDWCGAYVSHIRQHVAAKHLELKAAVQCRWVALKAPHGGDYVYIEGPLPEERPRDQAGGYRQAGQS